MTKGRRYQPSRGPALLWLEKSVSSSPFVWFSYQTCSEEWLLTSLTDKNIRVPRITPTFPLLLAKDSAWIRAQAAVSQGTAIQIMPYSL